MPIEKKVTITSQHGQLEMHTFTYVQQDTVYAVSYVDYPATLDVDKALDGARDGMLSNTKGKLINERTISLDKYSGRELLVDSPNGMSTLLGRTFIANNRVYQVHVVKSKGENVANEYQFLDSFRISEK